MLTYHQLALPNEIMGLIVTELASIAAPGSHRKTDNLHDVLQSGLGWIIATHISRQWRAITLSLSHLWAEVVLCFALREAIETIAGRARNSPITMDVDLLLAASQSCDITGLLTWLMSDPLGLFIRADIISCTLGFNNRVLTAADYSRDPLALSDWLYLFKEKNIFLNLTHATIPLTSELFDGFPAIHAPSLRSLTFIRVNVVQNFSLKDHSPAISYHTGQREAIEAWGELNDLRELLEHYPQLEELVIDGAFFDLPTGHLPLSPLTCSALTDVHILSNDLPSILLIKDLIITPSSCRWNITTVYTEDAAAQPLPSFLEDQISTYQVLNIDHSRDPTFLSFSASVTQNASADIKQSPLDEKFACEYKSFDLHARPGSITMACSSTIGPVVERYIRSLDTLVITRLDTLPYTIWRTPRGRRTDWTFLHTIDSLENIILNDLSSIDNILPELCCPSHSLVIRCERAMAQSSGLTSLVGALDRWRAQGIAPRNVTVTGIRRRSESEIDIIDLRSDLEIIDLRVNIELC